MKRELITVSELDLHAAVHEAGHAIAANLFGFHITQMRFTNPGEKVDNKPTHAFVTYDQVELTEENLRDYCTMLAAGFGAEIAIFGKHASGRSDQDLLEASRRCEKFGKYELSVECEKRACELFLDRKQQVWRLAHALCEKRVLSGQEIDQILVEEYTPWGEIEEYLDE